MKISDLSKDNISGAIKLGMRIFPWADDTSEPLTGCLKASLDMKGHAKELKKMNIKDIKYYLAIEDGIVVGLTGLFSYITDADGIYWVGWTWTNSPP